MGLSRLLLILVPFILLEGVQQPGLVEGSAYSWCPKYKIKCNFQERDHCTKDKHCPGKMKCCEFNCGKKCLDLKEDICSLPMAAGPCLALIPRWWYNKKTQTCSQFTYGGCQGNNNNFQSESVCQAICKKYLSRARTTPCSRDQTKTLLRVRVDTINYYTGTTGKTRDSTGKTRARDHSLSPQSHPTSVFSSCEKT